MITSKQRAEFRAQSNKLDTILMVGKGGISDTLIAETHKVLENRELVKGRVLETAMMSTREVSDALCQATGADGIQVVGSKFVIYRKSKKLEAQRQVKLAKEKAEKAKLANPVRSGAQARRKKAKEERERKQEYYHQAAVQAAIERRKAKIEE